MIYILLLLYIYIYYIFFFCYYYYKIIYSSTFVELETLESSAIKFHISTLTEFKSLFKKLKESTNPKDCINYVSSLKKISEVQKLADEQYVRLLTKFTGNKEARQMYYLFLKDVLVKYYNIYI